MGPLTEELLRKRHKAKQGNITTQVGGIGYVYVMYRLWGLMGWGCWGVWGAGAGVWCWWGCLFFGGIDGIGVNVMSVGVIMC